VTVTREEQLVEAFVEAADTLVDDFDVIEFLHTVAGRCVQLLDVDAAGVMLADQYGQLHATAASTESARLLELFELQADAGPCMDAFRTGVQVVNADLGGAGSAGPASPMPHRPPASSPYTPCRCGCAQRSSEP
jgi:hypothetical protein